MSVVLQLLKCLCSSIESRISKAIALLSDGGYSFSLEVLNVLLPVESMVVPMVNGCVFSGLWHVKCLRNRCLRMVVVVILVVKKVVGLSVTCPCMLWLKVVSLL